MNERKFLGRREHRKAIEGWKMQSRRYENPSLGPASGIPYGLTRIEKRQDHPHNLDVAMINPINKIHSMSFIDYLKERLSDMKKGEKVKVLDVGGGAGLFADQLLEELGDEVKAYTTGLNKKLAKKIREWKTGESKLPKNYLKWRSVRELSDYPEFDLIVDSFGEFFYITGGNPKIKESVEPANVEKLVYKYLSAVVAKLNDRGLASIAPLHHWLAKKTEMFRRVFNRIIKENPEWKIEYQVGDGAECSSFLRIKKINK